MEKLRIPATQQTPEIILDPTGYIKITGRSMNPRMTDYIPAVDDWIDNYISDPAAVTVVDFNLEYLNTGNINIYKTMLAKLRRVILADKKLIVNWHYDEDDIDIIEKGEDIASALSIPLRFCKNQ